MGWTDWIAHGLMLTMGTTVLLLPRIQAEAIARPNLGAGYWWRRLCLALYPATPPTRVGFAIFIMLAASQLLPFPATGELVVLRMGGIFFMLQVAKFRRQSGFARVSHRLFDNRMVTGWQNVTTWREAWEDREILTHVSNQLAVQSRSLKQSIKQTRDELKTNIK